MSPPRPSGDILVATAKAVQSGVRWLKQAAPQMDDARWIAITIQALIATERNPHAHILQKLTMNLRRQQEQNGSWNDEVWDTAWALAALRAMKAGPTDPAVERALRFIEATQDDLDGAWYEEPWETMHAIEAIAQWTPDRLPRLGSRAIDWLLSLQRDDGLLIGARYTGMLVSLLRQCPPSPEREAATQLAKRYLRDLLKSRPIWTSSAWSNYYALHALISGHSNDLSDPEVSRGLQWLFENQRPDGSWLNVAQIPDTAMAVMTLTLLLSQPLFEASVPKLGVVSSVRINGNIQFRYNSPETTALSGIENWKLGQQVRDELVSNQRRVLAMIGRTRAASSLSRPEPMLGPNKDEILRIGRFTYGALLPPGIQSQIGRSPVDHLRLDIDERLLDLPWELIHDGEEFLCLRYAVGRRILSSQEGAVRDVRISTHGQIRALVIANPTGDLPAAEQEGSRVARVLREKLDANVEYRKRDEITRQDFLLSLASYDVIHFAGHASHDSANPDESLLLFADGELRAFELRGFFQDHPPSVVFLNACESAEEGIGPDSHLPLMRGLGRTFLYAGTTAFLGYLAPVPDASAQLFAVAFYEALGIGHTVGEATRLARLSSRDPATPGDLTWASAILYGDPAARFVR